MRSEVFGIASRVILDNPYNMKKDLEGGKINV
jgi:hypothetical protein